MIRKILLAVFIVLVVLGGLAGVKALQIKKLIADGKSCRQFLKPGQKPEATFPIEAKNVTVREFCNLHGLWKA